MKKRESVVKKKKGGGGPRAGPGVASKPARESPRATGERLFRGLLWRIARDGKQKRVPALAFFKATAGEGAGFTGCRGLPFPVSDWSRGPEWQQARGVGWEKRLRREWGGESSAGRGLGLTHLPAGGGLGRGPENRKTPGCSARPVAEDRLGWRE